MLDVGKPCTSTNAGAPGVPQRRLNTAISCPLLAAVVDRQRSSVAPFCHSAKMSKPPAYGPGGFRFRIPLSDRWGVGGRSRAGHMNPERHLVDIALTGRHPPARP